MKEIGKLIVFRVLPYTTKLVMNRFCRQFYGYTDKSNRGRYTYHREGFLDNFNYIRPLRGVLIVRQEEAPAIIDFLKDYNAEVFVRDVILEEEDKQKLRIR